MMVLFISQSTGSAIAETRRVLDTFASRIGDNAWISIMTEAGVATVEKLLRRQARKNTAVCCHWIRSRTRREVLWTVGRRDAFTAEGFVLVNETEMDLIVNDESRSWSMLPLIEAVSAIAGLFHDFGKANQFFQDKIRPAAKRKKPQKDPLRHEYLSRVFIEALVKRSGKSDDSGWLHALASGNADEKGLRDAVKEMIGRPRPELPDAAALVAWLVLSHHRMPRLQREEVPDGKRMVNLMKIKHFSSIREALKDIGEDWGYCNSENRDTHDKLREKCLSFPAKELIADSTVWRREAAVWAEKLLMLLPQLKNAFLDGTWRELAFYSRLCLMLADHEYSSRTGNPDWQASSGLYANTRFDGNGISYNQPLDEHLVMVARLARDIARRLPYLAGGLPRLRGLDFSKRLGPTPEKFIWQDRASERLLKWRQGHEADVQGFFGVNLASTGCGKTLANAKIMQSLSDDGSSLRYTLALGLRTLTLQTGDEYREKLGMTSEDLAVVIGSNAIQQLHQESRGLKANAAEGEEISDQEYLGSASGESLSGSTEINFTDDEQDEILSTVITNEKAHSIFRAPVLACTIDHLMGATETMKGGRYILPALRLMSADLIIDEVDDFSGNDLIAISRLVFTAGMLGRKVMISSATIPPSLAISFFGFYQKGWEIYAESHGKSKKIGCGWIDEFQAKVVDITAGAAAPKTFSAAHGQFVKARIEHLKHAEPRRRANIVSISEEPGQSADLSEYFRAILQTVLKLHDVHGYLDEKTGIKVSFGVVRTANIKLCVPLTKFFLRSSLPDGTDLRTMAYHSQQLLIMRHEQERYLDAVLGKKGRLEDAVIRRHLDAAAAEKCRNFIFVLVATPVEEVGRDHDFDWAVAEPSSFRSIIQLAGRVRRHRQGAVSEPNVALLQYNWKGLKGEDISFCRPGFESEKYKLATHDLSRLVDAKSLADKVDAVPRLSPNGLPWESSLSELEHHATEETLQTAKLIEGKEFAEAENADEPLGYTHGLWWLTGFPQELTRFRASRPRTTVYLVLDGTESVFRTLDYKGKWLQIQKTYQIQQKELTAAETARLWLRRDYCELIHSLAQRHHASDRTESEIFGAADIPFEDAGSKPLFYYEQLGLIFENQDLP